MTNACIIGIDPGLDGGLALLSPTFAQVQVLPTIFEIHGKGRRKRRYDMITLRAILKEWDNQAEAMGWPVYCFLERQGARPENSSRSAFTAGMGFGILRGLLYGLGIKHKLVMARTWQKQFWAGKPANTKAASIAHCQEAFPHIDLRSSVRCRMPHDGLADALCIAHWGHINLPLLVR